MTLKVAEPVLPLPSLAEQLTTVVPSEKVLPEGGVQAAATDPAQASLAEAANETTAPALLVAVTMTFAGTLRTGGVVSTIVSSAGLLVAEPPPLLTTTV